MTKQEITDKIHEIICNKFMMIKKEISKESTFNDFGIDFLDLADILKVIGKKYKILIPNSKIHYFCNMTSVANFITSVADYIHLKSNK